MVLWYWLFSSCCRIRKMGRSAKEWLRKEQCRGVAFGIMRFTIGVKNKKSLAVADKDKVVKCRKPDSLMPDPKYAGALSLNVGPSSWWRKGGPSFTTMIQIWNESVGSKSFGFLMMNPWWSSEEAKSNEEVIESGFYKFICSRSLEVCVDHCLKCSFFEFMRFTRPSNVP